MKALLRKLLGPSFDVRKGEWKLALMMFFNYYLILVTYYLLKPARDSLFLVNVSAEQLPLVFIITAFVTVPVIALYSKASRKFKLSYLINLTTLILIANLFILRWLIQYDSPWIFYLFYTWVSIYGALTTSQFWLFGNAVFDANQAKRIFGLLALGGIVGAFTGGQVTSLIVKQFGISTENLLFFCVGFLLVTMVMITLIWHMKVAQGEEPVVPRKFGSEETKEGIGQIFGTIKRSKHLTLVVGTIAMTVMVASFVDYQFKVVAKESFASKEELSAFFGIFYSWLSIGSLVLQGLFTNRFLRILGVGGAIMFLPLGLLIGSVAMFIYPGLFAAVFLRGSDGAMRYSIDKTGKELLFLPISLEVKKRIKVFIDIFIDRWFRGIAGGLLLLCTLVLELSIRSLSMVVIGIIAVWLLMSLLLRKEYVNTFRKAIESRQIDLDELRLNLEDSQSLNAIIASLASSNDKQVLYALKMLDSVDVKELKWPVKPLLSHSSKEIRFHAVKVLQKLGDTSDLKEIEKLLNDEHNSVKTEAIRFICIFSGRDSKETLKAYLESPNQSIRNAAIACIVEHGDQSERELLSSNLIEGLLSDKGESSADTRRQVARVLGAMEMPKAGNYFHELLNDSSQKVVFEAIKSIGKQQVREFVPWLIEHLENSRLRQHCRQALAAFGTKVLGTLHDYLDDEKLPYLKRRYIPRVMGDIPSQETVILLTRSYESQNSWLAYDILKALNRLRKNSAELKFADKDVVDAVMNVSRSYFEIHKILQMHVNSDTAESKLLEKSLRERLDANLENIFRLLGLSYPPRDIFNAYQSVVSKRRSQRALAIEYLDNLLKSDLKKFVLPILDEVSQNAMDQQGKLLFKLGINTKEEGLKILLTGTDIWLKVCALYNVIDCKSDSLMELVKNARHDKDPMVRETAELVLRKAA